MPRPPTATAANRGFVSLPYGRELCVMLFIRGLSGHVSNSHYVILTGKSIVYIYMFISKYIRNIVIFI